MEFFNSAVDTLRTIVIGLGGALCVWGRRELAGKVTNPGHVASMLMCRKSNT